jgi:hypothetical protein
MWFNIATNGNDWMRKWSRKCPYRTIVLFILTFSICFPITDLLKLVVTGQKLFVVDRFVAGLITSLLQTWQEQFATGLLEQVVTNLLISTDFLQVVLSDLLSLVCKRFVPGCFNKSLRLCCQQLATDLFPQACYRLTKPTDLSRLVDNLPQAGKINNLRQTCEISGCVDVSEVRGLL